MSNRVTSVAQLMNASPVIPVIVINDVRHAAPLAQALVSGGLKVLEVTLRTVQGLDAIRAMVEAVPEAIVGAGTVVTPEQMDAVIAAGAEFIVTPGATPRLIETGLACPIHFLPGSSTVSEVMRLLEYGIEQMKFFPAEASGGLAMLRAIHGPLPQVSFCPTGGITPESAPDYLALPNVGCVGGSWMVPQKLVDDEAWGDIERLAGQAASLRR